MNNCYEFTSVLKDELYNFVNFKRSLGHKYDKSKNINCKKIDNYFLEHEINEIKITKEIVDDYLIITENEHPDTYKHRVGTLRQFSLFLLNKGYKDCILFDIPKINYDRFRPYIYSEKEIIKILEKINESTYKYKVQTLMIIKLLYCTGLRISEAFNIKYEDISKDKTSIVIKKSKNYNTRIIYLSDYMIDELTKYLSIQYLKDDDYLFKNNNNDKIEKYSIEDFYRRIIIKLNYSKGENGSYPRLHDLRHSFAVITLNKMFENGYDYYNVLPMLSYYLGHKNIESTEYYITLTKQLAQETVDKLEKIYPGLIPSLGGAKDE